MNKVLAHVFLIGAFVMAGCRKPPAAAPPAIKTITTPSGIEMVLVPGGSFVMGSETGDEDEKPAHPVMVKGFYMDRYELTQKAFEALMGTNPSKFKDPQKPVERASWVTAIKYCNMRSLKEGLQPCYDIQAAECNFAGNGYRLPTEAEWECACRAGTTGVYSFGDNPGDLASRAWNKSNSHEMTHPVGQKQPNPWGLYDMYGNVAEWCNDRYGEKEYALRIGDNPHGPAKGNERVLRGGSWRGPVDQCRSSARASETPGLADVCFGYEAYGFRCVKAAP
jgi:formylglycine-generating enzyme required for sulfatase activity